MICLKKILAVLTLFVNLVSCKQDEKGFEIKNDKSYLKTHTLKKAADKIIKLDTLTDPWQLTYDFYDGNSESKLFILSDLDNSIQQYDWNSGLLLNKKKLPKEGPNGVGTAGCIMVKNLDSIFITSGFQFKLHHLNRDYSVKKSYSLLDANNNKPALGKGMFVNGRLGYFNNKVYLGGYPFIDRGNKEFYTEGATSVSVDLTTKDIKFLTKVPPSYIDRFKDGYMILAQQVDSRLTFNYKKQQMIINYLSEPFIEVYDLQKNNSDYYYAGTDEFDEIVWAKKNIENDSKRKSQYLLKMPQFTSMTYDSYRKVYYRIFEKPNPAKIDGYDGKPWTIPYIIILDEEFKKIGEIEIPKEYSLTSIIITKEGPYLRKSIHDEDKIIFTLFELIKL